MALVRTVRQTLGSLCYPILVAALACALLGPVSATAQQNAPAWWGTSDNNTVSLGFQFSQDLWQPVADYSVTPAWYAGTTWARSGQVIPQWTANLAGHTGVWGLTSGSAGEGDLVIRLDNQRREGWVKHVWYQFDRYGPCCWVSRAGESAVVFSEQYTEEELSFGWTRVTGSFDILPQPDWEELTWTFTVEAAGKAAIDNLYVGSRCEQIPEPAALITLLSPILALIAKPRRRK